MTEDDGIDWEKIKAKKPWEYARKALDLAQKGPEYIEKTTITNGEIKKREYVRYSDRSALDWTIKETPVTYTDNEGNVWQWDKSNTSPLLRDTDKYRKVRP